MAIVGPPCPATEAAMAKRRAEEAAEFLSSAKSSEITLTIRPGLRVVYNRTPTGWRLIRACPPLPEHLGDIRMGDALRRLEAHLPLDEAFAW